MLTFLYSIGASCAVAFFLLWFTACVWPGIDWIEGDNMYTAVPRLLFWVLLMAVIPITIVSLLFSSLGVV